MVYLPVYLLFLSFNTSRLVRRPNSVGIHTNLLLVISSCFRVVKAPSAEGIDVKLPGTRDRKAS